MQKMTDKQLATENLWDKWALSWPACGATTTEFIEVSTGYKSPEGLVAK